MSSKKLLSELMTKINSEDILNETGGKWSKFQCVSVAAACAVGPICGHYSPALCDPGGLLDKNCK